MSVGYDLQNMSDAGWGVLLAEGADPRILKKLEPLIELRRQQANGFIRIFDGESAVRQHESAADFVARNAVIPGPADHSEIPYYLLIVASPAQISFLFQSRLAIQVAVGRLWFDDLDAFARYASSAVKAELQPRPVPAEHILFRPAHEGDLYTLGFSRSLGAVLTGSADTRNFTGPIPLPDRWINQFSGEEALKGRLIDKLAADAPRLVLAAGHSLIYPPGASEAGQNQGALVCSDWQRQPDGSDPLSSSDFAQPLDPTSHCFGASDVAEDWDLTGRMFIFYGSYSLGTPANAGFEPFLAALPQRLLSLRGGSALGFFGWADRVWGYNEPSQLNRELVSFTNLVRRLDQGQPAGLAMEDYSRDYAELESRLVELRADYRYRPEVAGRLAETWVGMNNARGLQFFGDPATRLLAGLPEAQVSQQVPIEVPGVTPGLPQPEPARSVFTELELVLSRSSTQGQPQEYDVCMHISWPAGLDRTDEELQWKATINPADWPNVHASPDAYGEALTQSLFCETNASTLLNVSTIEGEGLRITLEIDESARELNNLAWELLKSPWDQEFLLLESKVALKKPVQFILRPAQHPLLPVNPRRISQPRALIAISSPAFPDQSPIRVGGVYLPPIDVDRELQRARQVLQNLAEVNVLESSPDEPDQSFIERLHRELLREYDILYLVANSGLSMSKDDPLATPQPFFVFERDDGHPTPVEPKHLARRLAGFTPDHRPCLVVLSPPQQATNDPLGLGLLEAASSLVQGGVNAVVTFRDRMSTDSQASFLMSFFDNLAAGATAGEAFAKGRASIQTQTDWWAPVLYASQIDSPLWVIGPPQPPIQLQRNDISIQINRSGVADYTVSLEAFGVRTPSIPLALDFNSLRATQLLPDRYGQLLFQALFNDPSLRKFWMDASARVGLPDNQASLNLIIDRSALELHDFAWETLYDIDSGKFLAMDENLAFTRFSASEFWSVYLPERSVSEREETMLIAIANPPREGRKEYKDTPSTYYWEPGKEVDIARRAAQGLVKESIDLRQQHGLVNLETLSQGLSQGCDILLLFCASISRSEDPGDPNSPRRLVLALDGADGQSIFVSSDQLVELLRNLWSGSIPPRLVILAGADTASALGPRLIECGAPQVIGMQRNTTVGTYHRFLPIFFAELARDWNVGRASAVARSVLRDERDWHYFVFYSRIKPGAR